MKKILHKTLSILLLAALLMNFSVPALADETTGGDNTPSDVETSGGVTAAIVSAGAGVTVEGPDENGVYTAVLALGAADALVRAEVTGGTAGEVYSYAWSDVGDDGVLTLEGNEAEAAITPLSRGETVISVKISAEGSSASPIELSCRVTVNYAVPVSMSITTSDDIINKNATTTFRASVTGAGSADIEPIKWTSGDEKIATVTKSGDLTATVKGISPGETYITAATGEKSATRKITVSGIVIPETKEVIVGNTVSMSAAAYGNAVGLPIEWESSNTSVAFMTNDGQLVAQTVGSATITASCDNGAYTAECVVNVVENTAATVSGGSVDAGQPLYFDETAINKLRELCIDDMYGYELSYVTNLKVATDEGLLCYGYVSSADMGYGVGSTERYYIKNTTGQRSLADVVFISLNDFSGTATISYTGYDVNNNSYQGKITIEVIGGANIPYVTSEDTPITFMASDFNNICQNLNGRSMSYVQFSVPSESQGVLYYNYDADTGRYDSIAENSTKYYRLRSPYLDNVTFVPAEGFAGTVTIEYSGVDTAGVDFSGSVIITVTAVNTISGGYITYNAAKKQEVQFNERDFSAMCSAAVGGTLDCVRFTLPSASEGRIYHKPSSSSASSPAAANSWYYYSSSPYLSGVYFEPAEDFVGTVYIDFVGYNTSGTRFTGCVRISYSDTGDTNSIIYTGKAGQAVSFVTADFNDVCYNINGHSLDYVEFTLPSSGVGTLYYNYNAASSTREKVDDDYKYYRSSYRYISSVSFVPDIEFSGTAYIQYTGYDTEGLRFDGIVQIEVAASADLVMYYSTYSGVPVDFSASSFNSVCVSNTGYALNYVRFTPLPSSSEGVLYYNYNDSTGAYGSRVSEYSYYYYSGSWNLLEDVSFVPAENYSGTVTLNYVGYNSARGYFNGVIKIVVSEPIAQNIRYYGSSLPIAFKESSFNNVCSSIYGRDLSYIRFTALPTKAQGRLCFNYSEPVEPGLEVALENSYYYNSASGSKIGDISFVAKAGYTGTVTLPYTAYDTAGKKLTGKVIITISDSYCGNSFNDMGSYGWARPSVEYLHHFDVIEGTGNDNYSPRLNIRRGDFVLMLCRAFRLNTGSRPGFSDVSGSSYYAWAIGTAEDLGIVTGSEGKFMPDDPITRQDAMVMIYRTMQAAGREFAAGSESDIAAYGDNDLINGYARDAVAALVKAGIIQGDDYGLLKPRSYISRAEVAVMLHRVLTMN